MCDTLVLRSATGTWFAKNSDREPSEPQLVLRLPAVAGDHFTTVRATHIEIPQARQRHGVILCKPAWMWGAEMGVNDQGVAIGNEAIFSRVRTRKPALLGMDLLRIGLERGGTARAALELIIEFLERFGQGGPAGFRDKRFCYDSSFLIADPEEAWLLETVGKHWAAKQIATSAAVSNALTLGAETDRHSSELHRFARQRGFWHGHDNLHFAKTFDTSLMPHFARAAQRRACNLEFLSRQTDADTGFKEFFGQLRTHADDREAPAAGGSNADICMHAGGFIRRNQTTGSLVAHLEHGASPRIFVTGTSAPCLSLFRPVSFDAQVHYSALTDESHGPQSSLWWNFEPLHRRALFDAQLRNELRAERDDLETQMLALPAGLEGLHTADQLARGWDTHNQRRLGLARQRSAPVTPYWRRLSGQDGMVV